MGGNPAFRGTVCRTWSENNKPFRSVPSVAGEELPRTVGLHPDDGQPILASPGRFGPYIKHGDEFRSLASADQIFTIISELVTANQSRRRPAVTILAEQDKVEMEDLVRQRVGSTGKTRIVCRTGSPLDVADLALVNPNEARSIIVLAPPGTSVQDADAYVRMVKAFAEDRRYLGQLHAGLRTMVQNSPICDCSRFARVLEDLYRSMWKTWCLGGGAAVRIEPNRGT